MSSEEEGPVAWLRREVEAHLAAAKALATPPLGKNWVVRCNGEFDYTVHGDHPDEPAADIWRKDVAEWVAANDPESAIARCEAELAILDACASSKSTEAALETGDISAEEYVTGEVMGSQIIRLLAGGYKHRPGYSEEDWKRERRHQA